MNDESQKPLPASSTQPSPAKPAEPEHRTPPDKHESTVVWPHATAGKSAQPSERGAAPAIEAIGKYRIIGVLDAGGQGDVYRALHPQLQKELVIKVGRRAVEGEAEAHDRLIAEGRVLAELDHPHLARVYDLDFFERRPYLVMEYIRGRNLRQHAAGGNVSWREAARLVAETARALAVAHARGVLHLDVKPENVIVDEKGAARLIDFGLARLRHAWSDDASQPGSVSGTIPFMAPEQARGEADRLDQRTDVFALGAVLYWLLAGKPPFGASSVPNALVAAQNCSYDRAALEHSAAPRAVIDACLRAMQAEQDDRFASAGALAEALERIVPPGGRARNLASMSVGNLGCAVTVTACTLFVAVGYALWTTAGNGDREEVAVATPRSEEIDAKPPTPDVIPPTPQAFPPDAPVPPIPGPVERLDPPDQVRAAKIERAFRGYVERDKRFVEIGGRETPVVARADRLRFVAELPKDAAPALFVLDGPGMLRRFEMQRGQLVGDVVPWTWEGTLSADANDAANGLRTVVVFLCANRLDDPTQTPQETDSPSLEAVRDAFDATKPWPVREGSWALWFDAEAHGFISSRDGGEDQTSDERAFRETLRVRADASGKALGKRFPYAAGIAFPANK